MERIKANREFMKACFKTLGSGSTDQVNGVAQPPLQKPYDEENGIIIRLPVVDESIGKDKEIYFLLKERRSRRKYSEEYLTLMELSYLLWATQGVDRLVNKTYATLRPVPSGGARHPFETYLIVNRVEGVENGIYRYLPLTHELLYMFEVENVPELMEKVSLGQKFVADSAVLFIWSCIPYRGEWRYSTAAHKTMLLDAGHVCQNLYIACESIDCGTCAIASYDQEEVDKLLELDGDNEFVVYMAPVGKR